MKLRTLIAIVLLLASSHAARGQVIVRNCLSVWADAPPIWNAPADSWRHTMQLRGELGEAVEVVLRLELRIFDQVRTPDGPSNVIPAPSRSAATGSTVILEAKETFYLLADGQSLGDWAPVFTVTDARWSLTHSAVKSYEWFSGVVITDAQGTEGAPTSLPPGPMGPDEVRNVPFIYPQTTIDAMRAHFAIGTEHPLRQYPLPSGWHGTNSQWTPFFPPVYPKSAGQSPNAAPSYTPGNSIIANFTGRYLSDPCPCLECSTVAPGQRWFDDSIRDVLHPYIYERVEPWWVMTPNDMAASNLTRYGARVSAGSVAGHPATFELRHSYFKGYQFYDANDCGDYIGPNYATEAHLLQAMVPAYLGPWQATHSLRISYSSHPIGPYCADDISAMCCWWDAGGGAPPVYPGIDGGDRPPPPVPPPGSTLPAPSTPLPPPPSSGCPECIYLWHVAQDTQRLDVGLQSLYDESSAQTWYAGRIWSELRYISEWLAATDDASGEGDPSPFDEDEVQSDFGGVSTELSDEFVLANDLEFPDVLGEVDLNPLPGGIYAINLIPIASALGEYWNPGLPEILTVNLSWFIDSSAQLVLHAVVQILLYIWSAMRIFDELRRM